jgi:hypothetical protein
MADERNASSIFVFLAAVLFALHFQIMSTMAAYPHVETSEHLTADIGNTFHPPCQDDCCAGASCCIQAINIEEAAADLPEPERFLLVSHRTIPLPSVKPIYPPPRMFVA